MLLKYSIDHGLVNGSLGIVEALHKDSGVYVRTKYTRILSRLHKAAQHVSCTSRRPSLTFSVHTPTISNNPVVLLKNYIDHGLVNGSRGIVEALHKDSVTVRFLGDKALRVNRHDFQVRPLVFHPARNEGSWGVGGFEARKMQPPYAGSPKFSRT